MNRACDKHETVLAGARTGNLGENLAAHLRGCAACREMLAVDASLRAYAQELRAAASPPNLEGLLWRAELRRRLDRAERGARVLSLYDRLVLAGGLAGLGLALVWNWNEAVAFVSRWLRAGSGAPLALSAQSALAGLTAVLVLSLIGWLMTLWAEE